jgi:hypothetical protein
MIRTYKLLYETGEKELLLTGNEKIILKLSARMACEGVD